MRRYVAADSFRLITSGQFYIGIVGIACIYLLGTYQAGPVMDVYTGYFFNSWFSTWILSYAFCAVPFSSCYVEDAEQQSWYHQIQRGSLREYAWSKTLVCFWGGVAAMVLGVLLFVLALSFRYPLLSERNHFVEERQIWNSFGFFLNGDTMLLYFICSACMCGLMGGIFAQLSAWLSLYEKNRLFTICAPVIGVYFIDNFLTDTLRLPDAAKILAIFNSDNALFEVRWLNIVYAVIVALAAFIGIGILTERKIEREIYGGKGKESIGKLRAKHKKKDV